MFGKSSFGQADFEKRSKLFYVKGTGSSKTASHYWLLGKVTSVLSIPLIIYIFISLVLLDITDIKVVKLWFSNIFNITVFIVALLLFSWHLLINIEEAFHDYIQNNGYKFIAIIFARLFVLLIVVFTIINAISLK